MEKPSPKPVRNQGRPSLRRPPKTPFTVAVIPLQTFRIKIALNGEIYSFRKATATAALNTLGLIARKVWKELPQEFPAIRISPAKVEADCIESEITLPRNSSPSLAEIIRYYKLICLDRCTLFDETIQDLWAPGFIEQRVSVEKPSKRKTALRRKTRKA